MKKNIKVIKNHDNDIFDLSLLNIRNKAKHAFIFSSDYNAFSIIIKNYMNQLSKNYEEFLDFKYFDLEKDQNLFTKTKITNVPTIFFIEDNDLINYTVGPVSKNDLKEKIDAFISNKD